MNREKRTKYLHIILAVGILMMVNILANTSFHQIDLTDDKRFTLSEASKKVLYNLEDQISIRLLLPGNVPAEFKRLQISTVELLAELRSRTRNITYFISDPNAGTTEEVNKKIDELRKDNIIPQRISIPKGNEYQEVYLYPYAIVNFGDRYVPISLLEPNSPGIPAEVTLNNSISLLEYKFVDAIQKLTLESKSNIVFTTGHGELEPRRTAALETLLRPYYNTGRMDLSELTGINEEIDLVVVAGPSTSFSDKDLYKLDQYIMHGGKVVWFIDPLKVSVDSIGNQTFVPPPNDVNLDDMFFKYGFRLDPNTILDLECSTIPLATGMQGNRPVFQQFNYFYHPLILPKSNHPVVKGLGRISMRFPGTIDTVKTKHKVDKTVLLTSSEYSRTQMTPVRLDFEILRAPADPKLFNQGEQIVGLLLEGTFASFFENRIKPGMQEGMQSLGQPFKVQSEPTKMIIVSDAGIIENIVGKDNRISPIGYNRFNDQIYKANEDFALNLINYLFDSNGIMEARSKEVKLRLLDAAKVKTEKSKWQLINIAIPLFVLVIFGYLFGFIRKRRYGRPV